jgi:hypothetical protein
MSTLFSFIVTRNDRYARDFKDRAAVKDGGAPEYLYHDRTAWRCAVFVGKRYGSKGYPQRNVANSIQEEIKSRLKLGNACYYSVQNPLSSSLLSKS